MERAGAVRDASKENPDVGPVPDLEALAPNPYEISDPSQKRAAAYTKHLLSLWKSALTELRLLLKNQNPRIRLQTALGVTRATVSAITKDTLPPGGGASIHIHASGSATVIQTDRPPSVQDERSPHQRTGHPVMVTK